MVERSHSGITSNGSALKRNNISSYLTPHDSSQKNLNNQPPINITGDDTLIEYIERSLKVITQLHEPSIDI